VVTSKRTNTLIIITWNMGYRYLSRTKSNHIFYYIVIFMKVFYEEEK